MKTKTEKKVRFFSGKPQFNPGRIKVSHGVQKRIAPMEAVDAVFRHIQGDWGNIKDVDWNQNDLAIKSGGRLFSSYRTKDGIKFWIVTSESRKLSMIMLPEEY